jgi:hypothetical protein
MIQFKLSNSFIAKQNRIKKLPLMLNDVMQSFTKKDANDFIKIFQDGIKQNSLGLKELNRMTVMSKREMGLSRPDSPLYAKGEETKNSLINAHYIKKIKNGYAVKLREARHHNLTNPKSNITLKKLMMIHEHGATIKVTNSMRWALGLGYNLWLKKTTAQLRIPPRPARKKAYIKLMQMKAQNKRERSIQVRNAMRYYIREQEGFVNTLIAKNNKDMGFENNN